MKGMVQRLLTAIVFVAVMLGGLFGGLYPFLGLLSLICLLSLWEFSGIVLKNGNHLLRRIFALIIGFSPLLVFAVDKSGLIIPEWAYLLFLAFPFLIFIFELFRGTDHSFRHTGFMFTGAIYIGLPLALLCSDVFGTGQTYDPHKILIILLLVWASDTGAYLVGSMIGKTPLSPVVSPKKTWEGTVGGWIFAMVVSIALYFIYKGALLELWQFVVLALICGVFGTLGDLVESKFKRSYNIKDSGTILPGHGGMLDRFDAFLMVVPFAYIFFRLI